MGNALENTTLENLNGIQASIASLRDQAVLRFDKLEMGMDRRDLGFRKDRGDAAGMLMRMRATAGVADARVSEIKDRVVAPKSGTG